VAGVGLRRRGIGRGDDLPLTADINVTSLVDVAFTLLVIFIITAPILQGGIEVAVPRAQVRPLTAQERPFIITVASDGGVYMEEEGPVSSDQFESLFPDLASGRGLDQVYVRADSLASWAPVLRVIGAAREAGVGVSVVGEPYPTRR
jgi:biopolymer transport protein ExbD/biopolymer transport protein TolR